jgi:hypothetical protein
MKKIYLLMSLAMLALSLSSINSNAQGINYIGEGVIESHYPPNNQVWEYGWASMMYTSEEMGGAKTITSIAFDQIIDFDGYWEYAVLEDQRIYIKQTSDDEFMSLGYEDPENPNNGYTMIFSGDAQFNLGWTEFTLDEPFEYDGSSSFIVHWENHRGTSAPVVNVKFNATTVNGDIFKALSEDYNFPTAFGSFIQDRPNIAISYVSDGPATPTNPFPANASYKALVDTPIEFELGENTTSYDIFFGTDNPPTQQLVSNVSIDGPGVYSVNPSEVLGDLLNSYKEYFWFVRANNATESASSEIWSFFSQGVIEDFPYFTSFEDQPIRNFYADTVDWDWSLEGPANWRMLDYDVWQGSYAVACNVWFDGTGSFPLVSPRMYLPENQQVSFMWRIYNSSYTDADLKFDISVDGGQSWDQLKHLSVEEPMENYSYVVADLTGYSGNNTYLRWRFETSASWAAEYFLMDNLRITFSTPTNTIDATENLTIYPNPGTGIYQIETTEKINLIEIYNISGQLVETIVTANNFANLDLREHDNGVYIVKVLTTSEHLTKSIIKQ